MNEPRLHHYVPRFYLKRFVDARGHLHVWDKAQDIVFRTTPGRVAAENDFYWHRELAEHGHDPLTMEKQFAEIEADAALVTSQWLDWLTEAEPEEQIPIPPTNRELVSLFIALQYLRTADTRDLLHAIHEQHVMPEKPEVLDVPASELHLQLLWDEELVQDLADRVRQGVWLFARNGSTRSLVTSDNPVAFRTSDNRQWRRLMFLGPGAYAVYPLSPRVVMYCFDEGLRTKVERFEDCLSPIVLDAGMVDQENSGQAFMATRFVFAPSDDLDEVRAFARTIGTDVYAGLSSDSAAGELSVSNGTFWREPL
jgi:hypothetical protein